MNLPFLNSIGDWNPQLFRELKGRFDPRNIALVVASSLLNQILILIYFWNQIPNSASIKAYSSNRYCTGNNWSSYNGASCFILGGKPIINWQLWWLDVFLWVSLISAAFILIVGTFMLISDLSQEERRGTFNFLRLSPQSTSRIFLGKILGVPSLLYVATFLVVIPLHLWSAIQAQISLPLVGIFDLLLIACMILIYSAALLFSLTTTWLGGLQPWLGSTTVLLIVWILSLKPITFDGFDIINLFSPTTIIPYLIPENLLSSQRIFGDYSERSLWELSQWSWWRIPIGNSTIFLALSIFNYYLCIQLIWQSLNRYFRNSHATLLSKKQSYRLMLYWTLLNVGFTLQTYPNDDIKQSWIVFNDFTTILPCIFLFMVVLMAALLPHRTPLQDWARYHQNRLQTGVKYSRLKDWVIGEKSPAILALFLNALIAIAILLPVIFLFAEPLDRKPLIFSLLLSLSLILLLANLAQNLLLLKTPKRVVWSVGVTITLILAPPIVLGMLSVYPGNNWGGLWLFTSTPWYAIKEASISLLFQVFFIEFSAFSLLTWQLTRHLKKMGDSHSKQNFLPPS